MRFCFGFDNPAVFDRFAALSSVTKPLFLWIDFHVVITTTEWQEIRSKLPGVRCVVCVVPSSSADCVTQYEQLSFLAMQRDKVFVCLFCSGNNGTDTRPQEILAEHLVQSDTTTMACGIYHVSIQEVLWSPEQIRHRFRVGLAKKILLNSWDNENATIATCITDEMRPWRQDMRHAFWEEVSQRDKIFTTNIATADFTMDQTDITSRFGFGRPAGMDERRLATMIEQLAPEQNGPICHQQEGNHRRERFPLFFDENANRPFRDFPKLLIGVDKVLPTFYDFPETTSAEILQPEMDEPDDESIATLRIRRQANPFWSEQEEGPEFLSRLAQIPALMAHYTQERGAVRRQQRDLLATALTGIVADFRGLVDREVESVRAFPAILRSHPEQFHIAYSEVFHQILQPILNLRQASWGSRRFIFPLPAWLPGQIHLRTVIMRRLHELLGETVRLLRLYRYAFESLSNFREDIERAMAVVSRLNYHIEGLRRHRDNIVWELDMADKRYFERQTVKTTERFAAELPNPVALLQSLLDETSNTVTQIVQGKIFQLVQESRRNSSENLNSDFAAFLPSKYQNEDAWKAVETMLDIANTPPFADKGKLPYPGSSEYVVCCDWQLIPSLSENSSWRNLKKEALTKSSAPFLYDAVVRPTPDLPTEDLVTWIIETSIDKGILLKNNFAGIGLAKEIDGPWLPQEARRLFFQCAPGLDRDEFIKRCDEYILWALKSWLCYASYANIGGGGERDSSHVPSAILTTMSEEEVWTLVQSFDERQPVTDYRLNHPFYGQYSKDAAHFMLVDTLHPCLMRLFEARGLEGSLATRYFPEQYAHALFRNNEELCTLLFTLIFDYCVLRGEEPPFPFQEQKPPVIQRSTE